jgi:hypothetical protein
MPMGERVLVVVERIAEGREEDRAGRTGLVLVVHDLGIHSVYIWRLMASVSAGVMVNRDVVVAHVFLIRRGRPFMVRCSIGGAHVPVETSSMPSGLMGASRGYRRLDAQHPDRCGSGSRRLAEEGQVGRLRWREGRHRSRRPFFGAGHAPIV